MVGMFPRGAPSSYAELALEASSARAEGVLVRAGRALEGCVVAPCESLTEEERPRAGADAMGGRPCVAVGPTAAL